MILSKSKAQACTFRIWHLSYSISEPAGDFALGHVVGREHELYRLILGGRWRRRAIFLVARPESGSRSSFRPQIDAGVHGPAE